MYTLTTYLMAAAALFFIVVGIYIHFLRRNAENVMPAPFLNPAGKRKPRKRR